MMEFKPWPKIARLNRDITITEKIDGTNAAIIIEPGFPSDNDDNATIVSLGDEWFKVGAQSRNRIITPDSDNFGFAAWVFKHALDLAAELGPGYHYGEWWGAGIQRRYRLDHKRFSLFNTHRWADADLSAVPGLGIVPVLYEGTYNQPAITGCLNSLRQNGSFAAPGFENPEGIVVYHRAANQMFKVTLENDEAPKGVAA